MRILSSVSRHNMAGNANTQTYVNVSFKPQNLNAEILHSYTVTLLDQ